MGVAGPSDTPRDFDALRTLIKGELRQLAQHRGLAKRHWESETPHLMRVLRGLSLDTSADSLQLIKQALNQLRHEGPTHGPIPRAGRVAPKGRDWADLLSMLLNTDCRDLTLSARQSGYTWTSDVATYFGCTSPTSSRFRQDVSKAAYDVFASFLTTTFFSLIPDLPLQAAKPPSVLIICRFPPSDRARICKTIGELFDLTVTLASPSSDPITQREEIDAASSVVLIWEDLERGEELATHSLDEAITIARALGKQVTLINAALTSPLPRGGQFHDQPQVDIRDQGAEAAAVQLMTFFRSLHSQLDRTLAALPHEQISYRRLSVHNSLRFGGTGKVQTETEVELIALRDGLSHVQHSLHMNYKLYRMVAGDTDDILPLDVVGSDPKRSFRLLRSDRLPDKFTFIIGIDPPLRRDERTRFGWQTPWLDYTPLSRDQIAVLSPDEDFPFSPGEVEHHWLVNHPTDRLIITLEFETGKDVQTYGAVSFVGRRFRRDSVDDEETARISSSLTTREFPFKRKTLQLEVDRPLSGNLYAIRYKLPTVE